MITTAPFNGRCLTANLYLKIALHLEHFHNAGLSRETTRAIIESIPDPGSSVGNLRCQESWINGNWDVITLCDDRGMAAVILENIAWRLEDALAKGTNTMEPPINATIGCGNMPTPRPK